LDGTHAAGWPAKDRLLSAVGRAFAPRDRGTWRCERDNRSAVDAIVTRLGSRSHTHRALLANVDDESVVRVLER